MYCFSPNLQHDLKIQDKAFNLRENKALETCNNTGNRFHQAELTATWQAFPLRLSLQVIYSKGGCFSEGTIGGLNN